MGIKSKYSFKALRRSRPIAIFAAFLVSTLTLVTTLSPMALANGEKYNWEDQETISATAGRFGEYTYLFSKGQALVYPISNPQTTEVFSYSEPVDTPDGCFVLLAIQVNASDKSVGTLRRVYDPILAMASNHCPDNYSISEHFSTQLRLSNPGGSGSAPSTVVTVTIRSLVDESDDFPGDGDTFTLKNAGAEKILSTKKAGDKHAYTADGYKGYERTFKFKTTPGQKNYEACSKALGQCSTGDMGIITAPLGIYIFEIKEESLTDAEAVCSAGALGWVICPAMSLMVDVIEWVAGTLEGYLAFNPFAGSNNDIKRIWSSLLNVANSLLVVAFLVVVFSQSTSVGLSNYGIKRMLPRIIAAAILMNLSFSICQILVDLSNIAGVGVTGLVSATTNGTFADNIEQVSDLSKVVVGAGIIAVVAFFFLIPVLVSFLAIIFTIAARNALIVLLVIVAPLAFAAWIFPNTEKYFKKWWELLINLLLLFPLVMLMFSASVVAANVISSATPPSGDGGQELQGMIALLVLALPLFAMPFLFKVAGGALSKINALTKQGINQYGGKQSAEFTKGLRQDAVRNTGARLASNKFGVDSEGNRSGVRGKLGAVGAGVGGYNARRKFRLDSKKSDAERLQQDSIAQRLQNTDSSLAARSTLRGETGQAIARARGVAIQDKMIGEEMGAAKTLIENAGLTNAQLAELGIEGKAYARDKNGQVVTDANGNKKVALAGGLYQKSAASQLISTGQVGHVYKMLANAENMPDDVRASMEYNLSQNYSILKAKDHTLNDDSIKTALLQNGGKISADQYQAAAISKMSGLTKEVLAGQDAEGLGHLRNAIARGVGKPEDRAKALKLIHETMEDPLLSGKMTAASEKAFQAILQDDAYGTYDTNINPPQPPSPGSSTPSGNGS